MLDGFIRVAAGTPALKVADCHYNALQIIAHMLEAQKRGVKVLCLPELCLTGYTCGDLFLQEALIRGAAEALSEILAGTKELELLTVLGLPVRHGNKLYNCAAVICKGELLGLVPKTHLPSHGEFCEQRWFSSGAELSKKDITVSFVGQDSVDFSTALVFRCAEIPELTLGVELGADLWAPQPPSGKLAAEGATLILNLSAGSESAGQAAYRRMLVQSQSARLICGYVFAGAGEGESSTDAVYAGHSIIAENGELLSEMRFAQGMVISEIDVEKLTAERRRVSIFPPCSEAVYPNFFSLSPVPTPLSRRIGKTPFVPEDGQRLAERAEEVLRIQALGLKKRLEHTGARRAVIGLSGGLDSTLALLVTVRAFGLMGRERKDILTVTMPCFGTTDRTRSNAEKLAEALGTDFRTIDIGKAVELHLRDIGHDASDRNTTYENAQARERTQVLMDLANDCGGLVVGTGDLSELALGWCTYSGDHMSMYGVNAGVPKTLIRQLVAYEAAQGAPELSAVLLDILETPVSPELLPADAEGNIAQKTEDLVGPYELHDFFLYYMVRYGFSPQKIYRLALHAFRKNYSEAELKKWLKIFLRRFFSQQFKRSCMPDGPKVGSVSLSPRAGWHMPSDASAALWLAESEQI